MNKSFRFYVFLCYPLSWKLKILSISTKTFPVAMSPIRQLALKHFNRQFTLRVRWKAKWHIFLESADKINRFTRSFLRIFHIVSYERVKIFIINGRRVQWYSQTLKIVCRATLNKKVFPRAFCKKNGSVKSWLETQYQN